MNNEKFIEKSYNKMKANDNKSGKHGNLFYQGDTVYSYGYHYPLLFPIYTPQGVKYFVNDTGYSNTTAKHINHASGYSNHAVELREAKLINNDRIGNYKTVYQALLKEGSELQETMQSKKRKDTQVYSNLERQYNRIEATINAIK